MAASLNRLLRSEQTASTPDRLEGPEPSVTKAEHKGGSVEEIESASSPADARANILLVDDRPDKLMAFETILASLGQNLVLAHSGTEALRHLLQQEFALI